jgi:hypothetical protein
MPDARTVLSSPKLLDLIGIRATENAITLAARTSSRVARCPACGRRSARVHSHYTRMLADLCPGRASLTPFACASEGSSAIRRLATERSLLSPCPVSPHATVAGPSGSTAGSHARLFRPRRGSGISTSERPRGRGLRRVAAKPHPFVAAWGPPNAQGIERGRLRFPQGNPLRDGPGGSRTSHARGRLARQERGHLRQMACGASRCGDSKPGSRRGALLMPGRLRTVFTS